MPTKNRRYQILFAITVFLGITTGSLFAEMVYLLGEDVPAFSGLVLTANQCERKTFKGGLGVQGKQDVIELEMTLMNTGKAPVQLDPMNDFSLELSSVYPPTVEPGKNCLEKSFTVHPGAQSRGLLMFHVGSSDNKEMIRLTFKRGSSPVVINCDRKLAEIREKALDGRAELEEALKISQFLLDFERAADAEKLIQT